MAQKFNSRGRANSKQVKTRGLLKGLFIFLGENIRDFDANGLIGVCEISLYTIEKG
jgi:hypothetical protein